LNYPDRRVQFVAADALLRLPGPPSHPATHRVVDVLRRHAAAEPKVKVLVADANPDRAIAVAEAAKKAGFESAVAVTGREALPHLKAAAAFDALFVDHEIPDSDLVHLLAQARGDPDTASLPVFITLPPPPAPDPRRPAEGPADLKRRQLADEAALRGV